MKRLRIAFLCGVAVVGGTIAPVAWPDDPAEAEWEALLDLKVIDLLLTTAIDRHGSLAAPSEWAPLGRFARKLAKPYQRRLPTHDPWNSRYMVRSLEDELVVVTAGPNGMLEAFPSTGEGLPSVPWVAEATQGDDIVLVVGSRVLNGPRTTVEHQRRTLADLRSVGTAIETYSIDHNLYPAQYGGLVPVRIMKPLLEPTYIRVLPNKDSWGHDLLYWSDESSYIIISTGNDAALDQLYGTDAGSLRGVEYGGAVEEPSADIVFANGSFVQWPKND